MDINQSGWLFAVIFCLLGAAAAYLLVKIGATPVAALLIGSFASIFILRANDKWLIVLLVLTLAMGSYYRTGIAQKFFYWRFVFMGLIALRGVHLIMLATQARKVIQFQRMTPIHWIFLYTGILGIASATYSLRPFLSAQRAISIFLMFMVVFVYYWIRSDRLQTVKQYAVALTASCAIFLGIGYICMMAGMPNMLYGNRLRLILWNPNQLGHYCALMAPLVVWYLFENKGQRQYYLGLTLVILLAISIVWTGSRGAILMTGLGCLVQFAFCYRTKLAVLLVAVSLLISVDLLLRSSDNLIEPHTTSIEDAFVREDTLQSGSGRYGVWSVAFHHIDKRPLLGYGFGVVDHMFRNGYFPVHGFHGSTTHNSYVDSLLHVGWIGTLPIILALLYLLFAGALDIIHIRSASPAFRLNMALYAICIIGVGSAFLESWLLSVGSIHAYPFWMAVMMHLKMRTALNDWHARADRHVVALPDRSFLPDRQLIAGR